MPTPRELIKKHQEMEIEAAVKRAGKTGSTRDPAMKSVPVERVSKGKITKAEGDPGFGYGSMRKRSK